jgi:hypothetical protein
LAKCLSLGVSVATDRWHFDIFWKYLVGFGAGPIVETAVPNSLELNITHLIVGHN